MVLVNALVEACETLIEVVLIEFIVLNIELSITVGLLVVLELKWKDVIIISVVVVGDIDVLDGTPDIGIDEWVVVDISSVELSVDEIEFEFVDTNGCEVIVVSDTVFDDVESARVTVLEVTSAICVLSVTTKIREKRLVIVVMSD